MGNEKSTFEDFIASVDSAHREFVIELHSDFSKHGCKTDIKIAKSGYVVSYVLGKKTIANYVFRKAGLITRIYANHILDYMELLDTLPDAMIETIKTAPDCKRLINPDACNSKCAMGYDFLMCGERHQKCRYNAFMFLISEESKPFIKAFLQSELKAAK